jgi:hypothetical protein
MQKEMKEMRQDHTILQNQVALALDKIAEMGPPKPSESSASRSSQKKRAHQSGAHQAATR